MSLSKQINKTNNRNIYKLSEKIEVTTCNLKLLFPIQERYNQIVMKMEFYDLQNSETIKCIESIQSIENFYFQKLCEQYNYNNNQYRLKSQIEQLKNYNPYLLSKIIRKKNKQKEVITRIDKQDMSIYDIKAKDIFYMTIFVDNLFINQNKKEVIMKWKVSNIYYN